MFVSRVPAFLSALEDAAAAAAQAMGEAGIAAVRAQMMTGYPRPIYLSGALYKDVTYAADGSAVRIGSTLPYARAVHDGTSRLSGRPYLADGLLGGAESIRQAAADTFLDLF